MFSHLGARCGRGGGSGMKGGAQGRDSQRRDGWTENHSTRERPQCHTNSHPCPRCKGVYSNSKIYS